MGARRAPFERGFGGNTNREPARSESRQAEKPGRHSCPQALKGGDFKTALLPVQDDGGLSAEASDSVVKDVLGGTAKSPDKDAAVSVSVRNATGEEDRTGKARVVLLNGGFTFVSGGTASGTEATSKVVYAAAADKENAVQVAKTLGLPTGFVSQGKVSANARVSVVLGQDYEPAS
ncbi:hypothetical protein STENM223S_05563 [Streptomyces tendae]